jgi:hypothetical protein
MVKGKVFFGKDVRGRPVYLDAAQARLNKAIPAATRAGKGVTVQMLAPQFALQGDGTYIFDPKRDSKMSRALASFCHRKGLPFQLIDLRGDAPPQVCLFEGLDARQMTMMFSAGFDLADSGEMDRVYRLGDRNAAAATAALAVKADTRALPEMLKTASVDENITQAKVFWGFLTELAGLPSISAKQGFDLTAPFTKGGIVYIMGDPLDPIVKMAQKMLLVRVLMQIYQRPRFESAPRWIGVVLDEFKHLLSIPACDALGMIQDFQGHATLLFQSFGDFAGVPGVDEKRVRGAVLDNCKLKMIFQAQNDETAQWAASETCTTTNYISSSDKAHDEDRSPGHWREGEVPSIHPNTFKRLPPLTAALIVGGDARLLRVAPLQHLTKEFPPLFKGVSSTSLALGIPVEAGLI